MYAVFEDGSRQYRVTEGDLVKVDLREAEDGSRVEFSRVLLYAGGDDVRIGQPLVEGARVLAEVVDHTSTKLQIQHFRRRKNYRRLRGHRQHYLMVKVSNILLPGQEAPPPQKKEEKPKAEPKAEKPAEPKKEEKKAEAKKPEPKKAEAKK
jgi:large subunit ribosomal protein L21